MYAARTHIDRLQRTEHRDLGLYLLDFIRPGLQNLEVLCVVPRGPILIALPPCVGRADRRFNGNRLQGFWGDAEVYLEQRGGYTREVAGGQVDGALKKDP